MVELTDVEQFCQLEVNPPVAAPEPEGSGPSKRGCSPGAKGVPLVGQGRRLVIKAVGSDQCLEGVKRRKSEGAKLFVWTRRAKGNHVMRNAKIYNDCNFLRHAIAAF